MTLEELTTLATTVGDTYAKKFGIDRDGLWCLAKMQEELGELSGAHLSATGQSRDRGKSETALQQAVHDEAADLFGFLLIYAAQEKIDLAQALDRKWGQYLPETADR